MDEDQANALLVEEIGPFRSEMGDAGLDVSGGPGTPPNNAEQWKQTLNKIANSVVVLKVVSISKQFLIFDAEHAANPPPSSPPKHNFLTINLFPVLFFPPCRPKLEHLIPKQREAATLPDL